jgi:hypothetical protein
MAKKAVLLPLHRSDRSIGRFSSILLIKKILLKNDMFLVTKTVSFLGYFKTYMEKKGLVIFMFL